MRNRRKATYLLAVKQGVVLTVTTVNVCEAHCPCCVDSKLKGWDSGPTQGPHIRTGESGLLHIGIKKILTNKQLNREHTQKLTWYMML